MKKYSNNIKSDLISFDYAIKYLLKDKGDYEIVEGFLSALLSCQGYKPVKITALLESDSNIESKDLKKSVADVIVQDQEGNNYIVEIDRSYTDQFLHKAVFNTSRLIVDNLGSSQSYLKIKKIFHINLVYFPFEATTSPLHHVKVIFHQIDNEHSIDIQLIDTGMHIFDVHNIFPEYFLISIPLFDDVIKQEIDEWLYVMKNSQVKESFSSPYMKKVAERLNILKMSNKERKVYNTYLMESFKNLDYFLSAQRKGKAEGKAEEKIAIAKNLLKAGLAIDLIAESTGLSIDEVARLKDE
jgi:predicted transposase/invertase (TIGR01784 family)